MAESVEKNFSMKDFSRKDFYTRLNIYFAILGLSLELRKREDKHRGQPELVFEIDWCVDDLNDLLDAIREVYLAVDALEDVLGRFSQYV